VARAASDIVLGSLLATCQTDAEAVARSRAIGRARQVRRAALHFPGPPSGATHSIELGHRSCGNDQPSPYKPFPGRPVTLVPYSVPL